MSRAVRRRVANEGAAAKEAKAEPEASGGGWWAG